MVPSLSLSRPRNRLRHADSSSSPSSTALDNLSVSSQLGGSSASPPTGSLNSPASPSSQNVSVITLSSQGSEGSVGNVVSKIETILESIIDGLCNDDPQLSIPFRRRSARNDPGNTDSQSRGTLTFPGRNVRESKKFAQVLRILRLSLDALVGGYVVTKRDIYYKDQTLFREQRVVDGLVDDIAYSLGLSRDELHIMATAKGLLAGAVQLRLADESTISGTSGHDSGVLIPSLGRICQIAMDQIRWILVIEKEATFRSLAVSRYWETSAAGQGCLVTGKGNPDLCTRSFLSAIHAARPEIPISALVDFDPDGLAIFRVYKYGSRAMDHQANLTVPGLRWLGVMSDDVVDMAEDDISESSQGTLESLSQRGNGMAEALSQTEDAAVGSQGQSQSTNRGTREHSDGKIVPLSARDRTFACTMMKKMKQMDGGDMQEDQLLRELQVMLMLNIKAEIQAIDTVAKLTGWLDRKLCSY